MQQRGELFAGRDLVDAASEVHLVYSSVRGGDRLDESGVDHADAKQLVEAYLRERATPATVIGPVYFMDNALAVDFSGLRRGVFTTPLSPHKRLDQVASADIGGMAVYAIEHPAEMIGRRVDIACRDHRLGRRAERPGIMVNETSGRHAVCHARSPGRAHDIASLEAIHRGRQRVDSEPARYERDEHCRAHHRARPRRR